MTTYLIYSGLGVDLTCSDICRLVFSQLAKVYLPVSRASTVLGSVEGLEGYTVLPGPLASHSLVGETALKEPNHGIWLGSSVSEQLRLRRLGV